MRQLTKVLPAALAVLLWLVAGCSSNDASRQTATSGSELSDRGADIGGEPATRDTIAPLPEGIGASPEAVDDSLVAVLLETARQHYLSALSAEETGDSVRSSLQFEEAISLLDRLSYVPGIEENRDFNDLSKSVIQDYETYITQIDRLGPESSVAALRAKLNQILEADTATVPIPTGIVGGTTVPLEMNSLVEKNIAFYQGRGRMHMERWLYLSGRYFPMMRKIFREEGLPEELVFLAMPESGLNPNARSWARAVGMWQFMKGTGSLYGLRSTFWYDERRDFEKATRAAARHLSDLQAEFGSWHLAIAAYNSGAGRIYRGIRRSGSMNFWEMRRHLPRETRNYVPQYIAVTVIGLNPAAYGFGDIVPDRPLGYEFVTVDDCIDLGKLAECAGTDVLTLRDLNPELVQWCTPPGARGYQLRVPPGSGAGFGEKYAAIPETERRNWIVHTVRRGETLSGISSRYGIPTSVIKETNRLKSTRLSVRQTLLIPVPRTSRQYASLVASSARLEAEPASRRRPADRSKVDRALAHAKKVSPPARAGEARVTYRVKKGDTIGHIAEWYSCRAAEIRNWNDIPYGSPIREGQVLSIWVPAKEVTKFEKVDQLPFDEKQALIARAGPSASQNGDDTSTRYLVRPGDTLEKIAVAYSVTVHQLRLWNNLRTSRIYAGQELTIVTDAQKMKISSSSSGSTSGQSPKGRNTIVHVVKSGETLWGIARAYSVRESDLRSWNNLGPRGTIKTGQELVIHVQAASAELR